jgi:hypothetical protein
MTDRTLVHADALHVGDPVTLPTGRPAIVRAIDAQRDEVLVEAQPWTAAFKARHLRRDDGFELAFLCVSPRAVPESGDTPTETEGEA